MIITYDPSENPLTPEQLSELDEITNYPIVFDEDCPELTQAVIAKLKKVNS